MKKIFIILLVLCSVVGCKKNSKDSLISQFTNDVNNSKAYHLVGKLTLHNNDDVYHYDMDVSYKKDNYYKVILTNSSTMHKQVILKNEDGVFVLTPSLNKSFRFQSDWPYNNSQIYLLNALLNDIKKDSKVKFIDEDNYKVLSTSVNYPNNIKLKTQKMYFNNKGNLKKVVVYDSNQVDIMSMKFSKIDFNPKFNKNDFDINQFIDKDDDEDKVVQESNKLDDVIYPLFVPDGTKLVDENKVKKTNGERVIMNFDGEKSFVLVEETADVFKDFTIIPTSGEPYFLMDSLGVATNNSLSWTSGGVDYYLISDVMDQEEMVEVAQSIVGIVSVK